ncbi:MAG: hypothetical protein ACK5GN_03190 [Pseudomonadota bacterium]|jgi:hypothetical protein
MFDEKGKDTIDRQQASPNPGKASEHLTDGDQKQAKIAHAKRHKELLEIKIDYVDNPVDFSNKDAWRNIVEAAEPLSGENALRSYAESEQLQHIKLFLRTPLLTQEQEFYLFRKMNYLKYLEAISKAP